MAEPTHFSLFSGIGGLDLAAEWAGFETVGQVEKDDYCRAVLEKHWPGVPRWNNIIDVTKDALRAAGIEHAPTVLSGGFPCQPFSYAGKRKGAEDDRYLWPEMLRVVQELRPAWVVGENVAGFVHMALDDVCADLERAGYTCRAFVFPAAGVGAPHKRDRVFIVAHAVEKSGRSPDQTPCPLREDDGSRGDSHPLCTGREERHTPSIATRERFGAGCGDAVTTPYPNICIGKSEREVRRVGRLVQPIPGWGGAMPSPVVEPGVRRVDDGVPARVDRLRALGNAVVPQQAYPIFAAIAEAIA